MTDVPFGVLLSGGLDSSLVAAVTLRHLDKSEAARQWGSKLHTFCIGLKVLKAYPITQTCFLAPQDFLFIYLCFHFRDPRILKLVKKSLTI